MEVFFATVVVVEVGAVVGFVATVLADDVGLANASVVVGPILTTFLLMAGALGSVVAMNTEVGVAYEVVGPMLTTFLLLAGAVVAVVCGIIGKALVGMGDMFSPVAYEVVGPMMTALLPMAAFFVLRTAPPLSEPPQALMATRETTVNEKAMTRGVIRIA